MGEPSTAPSGSAAGRARFLHGVASGDPSATSVTLWTRLTVPGSAGAHDHQLTWTLADDADLRRVVATGVAVARRDDDHTTHVVVTGLPPGTELWYDFTAADGTRSPVGRTCTLPSAEQHVTSLRIGVVCCARYGSGWFGAYRTVVDARPDLVVHLGDHLYEDGGRCVPGREHDPPHELITLDDYRRRHAQTCTDADAQALRAAAPMVVLWDDHEFADNAWLTGAAAHDRDDGPWHERVTAARQAWHEWMPFVHRPVGDTGLLIGHGELDRRLRVGDLVDLVVVDTRMSGRDAPAHRTGAPVLVPTDDRTLLSDAQRSWLREVMIDRRSRWRVFANQVHVGQLHLLSAPGLARRAGPLRPLVNPDQWDGYPRERELLLQLLREAGTGGVLGLSGDLHATFVRTVDDEAGPVFPEITTPSTMSTPFGTIAATRSKGLLRPALIERLLRRQNRGIDFVDTRRHGCTVLDVDRDSIEVSIHLGVDTDRPEVLRWRIAHDSPVPRRI
jgi:alkaline phosphatase D